MSKNNSQKKSVSAIVTRLLALAESFKSVTLSPLVEKVILGLCSMIEGFAEDKSTAPFSYGPQNEGEDFVAYAQRIAAEKAAYDSQAGDERKRVKSSLVDGYSAIIEENALSGKGIAPEVKARAEEALKAGKPVAVIATETGVSMPTLNNWKRDLGLVKPRTVAPATTPAAGGK